MWENWPARKLVTIELDGVSFYLDLRLWECREVHDFSNRFSLDDIDCTDNFTRLRFDPTTKNLFHGTEAEFELRKAQLKVIELPPLRVLDPVGFRAKCGLPPLKTTEALLKKKTTTKRKGKHL